MIDGPALTEVIALGQFTVPPAPAAALRIKRRAMEKDCTLEELAQIASVDPALSATLLGLANSGDFLPDPPLSTVRDAVARIGADELVRIAFAVTAADAASTPGPLAPLRLLAWRRSLTSAFLCRFVAERRGLRAEEAFACGLLHDFGWTVALCTLEDLLARNPAEPRRTARSWLDLVDQFHILLGHIAATRWNLSPLIAEVILCHHQPDQATAANRPLVEVVAACDRLVMLLEDQPTVTEADIAALPGFEGGVAAPLAESLPRIAVATARLLDATPAPAPATPAAPSKIARPPQTLRGKIKQVRWDASWVGNNGPVAGHITAVTTEGLVALFPKAPRENYILKLGIAAGGSIVEIMVTPVLIEQEGPEQRVEARLFALAGAPKLAWDQLYRAA